MYQAVPRKYRPQRFSSIVGQEAIVTTLKNALKFKRVAHAYLFCGSRGTGKTTLARLFAKALNCQALTPDGEPCNQCPSCLDITSGRSLDVLEIDGASNRGIDDIRQINETVCYASSSGKYKIYIIDEVHMLTKEAFNALLKTLEEPPPNVKFFFATTEPHKVLPTIISRCQRFDLNRIPVDQIIGKLKSITQDLGIPVEEEALALIAHQAEGGLRDAESLLDQLICFAEGPITYESLAKTLGLSARSLYFQLDQAIHTENHPFAFELAQEIFSTGKDLACFLDGLLEHFRTLLLLKLRQPLSSYLNENDKKAYLNSATFYTEEQCLYNLDYLIQWQKELSKTPFKRITLEMILLHLIRSKQRIALPTLVRRLQELEKNPGGSTLKKTEQPLEEKLISALQAAPKEEKTPAPPPTPAQKTQSPAPAASVEKVAPSREEKLLNALKTKTETETPSPKAATPQMTPAQLEEKLLNILHAPEPVISDKAPPKEAPKTTPPPALSKEEPLQPAAHPSRYDTLLRFTAVELEGVVKRD
jgi:DNA polymerase-3 subunit gamma/tau